MSTAMACRPRPSRIKKTHDRQRTINVRNRNADGVARTGRGFDERRVSLCRCDCGQIYNAYEGHSC